jgi:hypothetical protein
MSFNNSSQVQIPLSNPRLKYGKTFRISSIYLNSSSEPQDVSDLQSSSDSTSYYKQNFQSSSLNLEWQVIDPRNDYIYKNQSDIEKNVYISGFDVNIYENYGNLTGQNAINNGTKVFSGLGLLGNTLNYEITGDSYSRNYSVEITLTDFTGNKNRAILTTQNPMPNYSILSTGVNMGVFDCSYSGLTGANGSSIANGLRYLELYNFTGFKDGTFPDKSEAIRSKTGDNGFVSIELTPGASNYIMSVPVDLYSYGNVSGFFKPQEYITGSGFSGFVGNPQQPLLIDYSPEISNINGYRISGGDAYRYTFDLNYNTGSNLITTCYGVTGTGQTTGSVLGYDGEIFYDSGVAFDASYNYENTGIQYTYDNSLPIQVGFNTGELKDVTTITGVGFTGSGTYGSGAGEYWAESFPKYTGYVSKDDGGNVISGGIYNYGYYDPYENKFKCASSEQIKSGILETRGIYSIPVNNPNSYDIQYHDGVNFQKSYEQAASYLNSIGRMPAVIMNKSQLTKISEISGGIGWLGLRRNKVGVLTSLFSEDFSNQSFLESINIDQEQSRDIQITNLTGEIENSRLEINDVGEYWCWTNSSGTHIYKYAGSGYEKTREAHLKLDIKRNSDDYLIYTTGFKAESRPVEIKNLTGISGGIAIGFRYDFIENYYGSGDLSNYNLIQANLYTGDTYGFSISEDNLYKSYKEDQPGDGAIEELQSGVNFVYNEDGDNPPGFFQILPFDTIGTGVLADANKIIAEAEGGNPEDPIKLIQNDQITIVNLDGMRAANQNYIKVKFPFEHEYAPIVTFGIEYDGGDETMSYLGAMVVGKASTKDVSFLFTEIPPSDGYSLYVRSASGNTKTREFNFTPWVPIMSSLIAWYDASDISTITESAGIVSQVDDKSGNGFHLNVLTAGKTGPKTGIETLNGLNVFTWDTIGQVLENDSFSYDQNSNGLYFAIIFKCIIDNTQDFVLAGTENSAPGNRMAVRRNGNVNSLQIIGGSGTGSNIPLSSSPGSIPEGQDFLIVSKFNGSNSHIRIDGELVKSGNIGTNAFLSLNIGSNESETSPINGYIAEVVFFTESSDEEKIEGYMAHKWGASSKLPQGHPYKFAIPQA